MAIERVGTLCFNHDVGNSLCFDHDEALEFLARLNICNWSSVLETDISAAH